MCAGENELWSWEDQGSESSLQSRSQVENPEGRRDGRVLQPQEVTVCAPSGLLSR